VHSINASGHKYGLVYPGVGWAIWRDAEKLPRDLVFDVNYLGGSMPTFALNFSRPASQVLLQFYQFLRLGRDGYTQVQQACQEVAKYLAAGIAEIGPFELWNDGSDIPVFAWQLKKGHSKNWSLYHLSDRLRTEGWLVPAYPMPTDLADITVQRIVVRNGMSMDLADRFLIDMAKQTDYLDRLESPMPIEAQPAFHH
jgi:glutamate decarboxylase